MHDVTVDRTLGEKLQVNFNVTFPRMACSALGLDAMDASGEHQDDVMSHVYKTRLDSRGQKAFDRARGGMHTLTMDLLHEPPDVRGNLLVGEL